MRRIPREVAAEARAALESTLSACAAEGLAEHESGKRFAAPGQRERFYSWVVHTSQHTMHHDLRP